MSDGHPKIPRVAPPPPRIDRNRNATVPSVKCQALVVPNEASTQGKSAPPRAPAQMPLGLPSATSIRERASTEPDRPPHMPPQVAAAASPASDPALAQDPATEIFQVDASGQGDGSAGDVEAVAREDTGPQESTEIELMPEVVGYKRFGRYDTAFELASGGFATVYLARAIGPGGFEKFVAVKCIHEHLANQNEFVEMFLDEARIAASINHPNVCSVFDFGDEEGVFFLAMDYVVGEPLSKVMPRLRRNANLDLGASRYALAARIVADAADGLHAAHEVTGPDGTPMNVVHRDVAPVNLFLRYDGHIQVVDFGIAKAKGKMHSTAAGVMKGHMAYMSPEQFQGGDVDRRTDVWALGTILWELCYNSRLYKRDSDVNTMLAVLSEPIEQRLPPASGVPKALVSIIKRALAKEPDQRFATARELSQALHTYLQESPKPVASSELSEMAKRLFPNGHKDKLALIDSARKALTHASVADRRSAGSSVSVSRPEVSAARIEPARPPDPRTRAATCLEEVAPVPLPPRETNAPRFSTPLKVAGILVAMVGCVAIGALASRWFAGSAQSTSLAGNTIVVGRKVTKPKLDVRFDLESEHPGGAVALAKDGVLLGTIPLVTKLEQGPQSLQLMIPGQPPQTIEVNVPEEASGRSFTLKLQP